MKYTLKDMLYLMRLRGTRTNNESDSSGEGSGSGSSSGSAANVMIVKPVEKHRNAEVVSAGSSAHNGTLTVERSVVYDKTWQEVHDALAAGTQVFADVDFLMENQIEEDFMQNSDYNINDLYTRLFDDILYKQVTGSEQPATLCPITGTFVGSSAHIDNGTGDVYYGKTYIINSVEFEFYVIGDSADGAIYCNYTSLYDPPSDYNSALDDEYNQRLNEGNNSDNPEL